MTQNANYEFLEINTVDVFISGEEVLAFLEEMYGTDPVIDQVYESIHWGKKETKKMINHVKALVLQWYY